LAENYTVNYVDAMQHGQVRLLLVLIPPYWYFKYQNHWRYYSGVLLIAHKAGCWSSESSQGWGKVLGKCCKRSVEPCELYFEASVKSEGYILRSGFKNGGKALVTDSARASWLRQPVTRHFLNEQYGLLV